MPKLSGQDESTENDRQSQSPTEKMYGEWEPAQIPIAPDGGIAPGFAVPVPGAVVDPDAFICRQGPCRHFWQIAVPADAAEGTWKSLGIAPPRQLALSCIANPGAEMTLSYDVPITECNRWDPLTTPELTQLQHRRDLYLARRAADTPPESIDDVVDDSAQKGSDA